jgi:hypothetical protein
MERARFFPSFSFPVLEAPSYTSPAPHGAACRNAMQGIE